MELVGRKLFGRGDAIIRYGDIIPLLRGFLLVVSREENEFMEMWQIEVEAKSRPTSNLKISSRSFASHAFHLSPFCDVIDVKICVIVMANTIRDFHE